MGALVPYPITPLGSFLGVLLALLPLPIRFKSWNSGICMLGIWIAVLNLHKFVDTIIWHDNVNNSAPVWCDIGTLCRLDSFMSIMLNTGNLPY